MWFGCQGKPVLVFCCNHWVLHTPGFALISYGFMQYSAWLELHIHQKSLPRWEWACISFTNETGQYFKNLSTGKNMLLEKNQLHYLTSSNWSLTYHHSNLPKESGGSLTQLLPLLHLGWTATSCPDQRIDRLLSEMVTKICQLSIQTLRGVEEQLCTEKLEEQILCTSSLHVLTVL